ncbi:MAG TPA: hypothetical protein VGJ84_19745, partial [Polyangiaceae bacterium]
SKARTKPAATESGSLEAPAQPSRDAQPRTPKRVKPERDRRRLERPEPSPPPRSPVESRRAAGFSPARKTALGVAAIALISALLLWLLRR